MFFSNKKCTKKKIINCSGKLINIKLTKERLFIIDITLLKGFDIVLV